MYEWVKVRPKRRLCSYLKRLGRFESPLSPEQVGLEPFDVALKRKPLIIRLPKNMHEEKKRGCTYVLTHGASPHKQAQGSASFKIPFICSTHIGQNY